ncbi:translation initiation factor IF-2 [Medicago truncatula]|uniref:Translation initiation factor IF-2 n=1 Tax=Medicago truncatula TaxID=3880 RepID=A0A072UHC0_MEDTR|nr:translation initiation factor IF-2 [Medicago truncatula]
MGEETQDRKQAKVVVEDKKKNHDSQHSAVPCKPGDGNLRSPICCIIGDVNTGKTKLLGGIRGNNFQEGGIDQQSGTTYFPVHGNIMHGLDPETVESFRLLKTRNTQFIVALNKVDRICAWQTCRNAPIREALMQQYGSAKYEFRRRVIKIISQFRMLGVNTQLYYENKTMGETFNIVPTSAISVLSVFDCGYQCTVLEVKVIEGYGTTINVVLVNGVLHEGDQIVGSIVTTIQALLRPHPVKELLVKGSYIHDKEIKAVMGIKITAQGLEHAIAGSSLYVVKPDDDLEYFKKAALEDVESVLSRFERSGESIYVQATIPGSLLKRGVMNFKKTPEVNIPVSAIDHVHKKDVKKASARAMLEKNVQENSTILTTFDVKVTPEYRELASDSLRFTPTTLRKRKGKNLLMRPTSHAW